jgi:plasmid stability protein
MAKLILNDLDPDILEKLKVRATNHQRFLAEELKVRLQEFTDSEQIDKMNAFRE